jgi:hypothetical protein
MTDDERYQKGVARAQAQRAKRARPHPVSNKLGEPYKGPIPRPTAKEEK